jgi:hypothetical protein
MTNRTRLDANQVIKNVYNENVDALDTVGVFDEIQSAFLESMEENIEVLATEVKWDQLNTTFPSVTSELYTYKLNTIVVMTVLVNYTTAQKTTILSIQKTKF